MKKKNFNQCTVIGRVQNHTLAVKTVQNTDSKMYGKEYISGRLEVATDDEGLNVDTIEYRFVSPTTKNGDKNPTYAALESIINGKTVLNDGFENALMVKCTPNIAANDFWTDRAVSDENKDGHVCSKKLSGGFVTILSKITEVEEKRSWFECDMFINKTVLVPADPDRNIDADYMRISGYAFDYNNAFIPVEFTLRNSAGVKYFESLEVNERNPLFKRVWGVMKNQSIVTYKEEEAEFGDPVVRAQTRNIHEWLMLSCGKTSYDIGDPETGITSEDVKKGLADRETYLAEEKKRQDDWRASRDGGSASTSTVSAAAGGFNW